MNPTRRSEWIEAPLIAPRGDVGGEAAPALLCSAFGATGDVSLVVEPTGSNLERLITQSQYGCTSIWM